MGYRRQQDTAHMRGPTDQGGQRCQLFIDRDWDITMTSAVRLTCERQQIIMADNNLNRVFMSSGIAAHAVCYIGS